MCTSCALGAEESAIISQSYSEMTEQAAHNPKVPGCPQLNTSESALPFILLNLGNIRKQNRGSCHRRVYQHVLTGSTSFILPFQDPKTDQD